MKIDCPFCEEKAELEIDVIWKDEAFNNPDNDWKLTCEHCLAEKEAKFSKVNRIILSMLFLCPIAASWAIFLFYASILGAGWIRLLIFLIHIGIGIYGGGWLSTGYCKKFIFRNYHGLEKQ